MLKIRICILSLINIERGMKMTEILGQTNGNEQNEKLDKLFQAARNARETSDDATALKHYEEISAINPNSWEAMFYLVILKTNSIKNGEIASAAASVQNCLPKVFELIKNTISDNEEQKKVVQEVLDQCYKTALWLTSASENFYKSITEGNGTMAMTGIFGAATSLDATSKARHESRKRSIQISGIFIHCFTAIEKTCDDDEFYRNKKAWLLEKTFDLHFRHIKFCKTAIYDKNAVETFYTELKKLNPSYILPDIKATGNRNNLILGIALTVVALAIGIIYALWISNAF